MKTVDEWSLAFDQYYNNITSNQAPGLNEYEKSRFLTDAQEAVVVSLYNGTIGTSFEETEEVTDYLSPLVKQSNGEFIGVGVPHVVDGTKIYKLPDDMLFRTLELCTVNTDDCGNMTANVVPVTQDEFWRTMRNPFKGANERRVLRLAFGQNGFSDIAHHKTDYSELYSTFDIDSYTVRYIKRPEPIILADLDDGLTIRGENKAKTCKLDEAIHHAILMEAVKLAKAVWNS